MKHLEDRSIGLESETVNGQTELIGRDPRTMTTEELTALGHKKLSTIQAIRARCIDCCAGQPSEVRRCVAVNCPSWPFRMGWNPWRERVELSPERKAVLAAALAQARAVKND